ncbi:MAG: hypothetical protein GY856_35375 [bacterium]|nr:hypothetical protein [bacterium]
MGFAHEPAGSRRSQRELPAQILDSNTIEAFVGFAHEPASSRLNLREFRAYPE